MNRKAHVMSELTTWWIALNELDHEDATFSAAVHRVRLVIPRDEWERMGRPSAVEITPAPSRGEE